MIKELVNNYPLPLNGLRHFYWAAKLGSFKLAAETLHLSEAAISQQIRNLESALKIKLFHRSHQKVSLTNKGHQLFPYVQSAFISLHEGINIVTADPEPNRLTVSTIPSFATNWLIRRLAQFNHLHPKLSISIDTSLEVHDFESQHLDIAIRYGPGNYQGLKSEHLMSDPTVLVCHPKLVSNNQLTREDFIKLPVIIGTTDGVQRSMQDFIKFYQLENKVQQEVLTLRDGALGVEAARSGQGVTLQRISLVADLIRSGELVYAKDYASYAFSFYAVGPESHFENPKVIKFLTWLKSEMATTQKQIAPYLAKIQTNDNKDLSKK